MAGVSQRTRATAPRAACGAGLPSISTWRPGPSDQVATSWPSPEPSREAVTFQPRFLGGSRHLLGGGAAQAAAGGEERDGLDQVGLAGAVRAEDRHRAGVEREAGAAVGAEVGEAEAGDGEGGRPGHECWRGQRVKAISSMHTLCTTHAQGVCLVRAWA